MDRSFTDFYRLPDILRAMVANRRQSPSAYKKYSDLLISDKKENVIAYTIKAIAASFMEFTAEDVELVFKEPEDVSSFFINLCREYPWILYHELTHSEHQRRYQMLLVLRSLFRLKEEFYTEDICRELISEKLKDIWLKFLELFTDSWPQIRILCVEITEVLLRTQIDEQIVSTIIGNLKKRLQDVDTIIRNESALVVERCSQLENILDKNLMKHFLARIGDTDLEVRQTVLISVSNVFHTIRQKYCKSLNRYVFKLSTACLLSYNYTELEEEKQWIEEIFMVNLIDQRADMSTKMANLLQLICYCDNIGVQAISKIFHNQLIVRTLFAKLMVASKKYEFKTSIIYSNKKVAISLKNHFGYIDKIRELLLEFHLLLKELFDKDSQKFDDLLDVFMCKCWVTRDQSVKAIEDFFDDKQKIVESRALRHMKEHIIGRTGIGLIDVSALVQLFQHMATIEVSFVHRLVYFVALLSKCYSEYFTDQTVIDGVLGLPSVVLASIASDSVIQCMNFSDSLKQSIVDKVNASKIGSESESDRSHVSESSNIASDESSETSSH